MATKARNRDSKDTGTRGCAKTGIYTKTWKYTPKCAKNRCGEYKEQKRK